MVLTAIERADGTQTSGPEDMVDELRHDWAPKFCAKIDESLQDMAMAELKPHIPKVTELWEKITPLSQQDLQHTAKYSKPNTPGEDGIPASAWCSVAGACTLQGCAFALFNGIL